MSFQPSPQNIFWSLYLVWTGFQIYLGISRQDHNPQDGSAKDRGTRKAIIWSIAAAGLLAAFLSKRHLAPVPLKTSTAEEFGAFLALSGIALHFWAIATLGRHFRTIVLLREDHRLITDGPYRWFRHPSYTSAFVTLAGLGLILGDWTSIAIMILLPLPAFFWRVRAEETAMAAHFGDRYEAYRRSRIGALPPLF